jgi:hypothetical protein
MEQIEGVQGSYSMDAALQHARQFRVSAEECKNFCAAQQSLGLRP